MMMCFGLTCGMCCGCCWCFWAEFVHEKLKVDYYPTSWDDKNPAAVEETAKETKELHYIEEAEEYPC